MFDLALTFLLAAFVSAGASFFGIAGDAGEIVATLALVFVLFAFVLLGSLAFGALNRRTTTH